MDRGILPPFGNDGVWLRCNFHAHTTESDGMLPPAMLRRYYALGGYDALAITDHDRLTPPPDPPREPDNLLLLRGAELTLRAPRTGGPLHVVAVGIDALPRLSTASSLTEAVDAIGRQGGVAIVAHPWWSGLATDELDRDALGAAAAIEVYNAGCEVEQGRGNSAQYWDALLASGLRVNAIATDDHHRPGFDAFRGWTMVHARERSADAVLEALRAGAFYSTAGPAIHALRLGDDGLTVECSPAVAISALGKPPRGWRANAGAHGLLLGAEALPGRSGWSEGVVDGELLTGARFPRVAGLGYIRVEVEDAQGRRAWSNPIWLDGH